LRPLPPARPVPPMCPLRQRRSLPSEAALCPPSVWCEPPPLSFRMRSTPSVPLLGDCRYCVCPPRSLSPLPPSLSLAVSTALPLVQWPSSHPRPSSSSSSSAFSSFVPFSSSASSVVPPFVSSRCTSHYSDRCRIPLFSSLIVRIQPLPSPIAESVSQSTSALW
jgi:hypothetical protein